MGAFEALTISSHWLCRWYSTDHIRHIFALVVEWMTISAGIAFAFSIYSVAAHAWWQEELRTFRSSLRLRERELAEQAVKRALFPPTGTELTPSVEAEIAEHNHSFDWPNDHKIKH